MPLKLNPLMRVRLKLTYARSGARCIDEYKSDDRLVAEVCLGCDDALSTAVRILPLKVKLPNLVKGSSSFWDQHLDFSVFVWS